MQASMVKVGISKGHEPNIAKLLELIEYAPEPCDLVVIKPNLCAPYPSQTGATTDSSIVEQTIEFFSEHASKITLVESNGFIATAEESFENTGTKDVCENQGIEFVNLSKDALVPVGKDYRALGDFRAPRTLLEADVLVNLPVMKTHFLTTVTLGLKNMFGIIPGNKARYHNCISEAICDVIKFRSPDLTILDAIVGMEGAGPLDGRPKCMDLSMASTDVVALDTTACRAMRINPHQVEHLQKAAYYGLGESSPNKIEVVGERVEEVRGKFLY